MVRVGGLGLEFRVRVSWTNLDLTRICFGCIKYKFRILELLSKSCSDPDWSNVDPNLNNMALTRICTGSIKRQFWILELLSKSCSDPNGSHVDRNWINLDLTGICLGCIQLWFLFLSYCTNPVHIHIDFILIQTGPIWTWTGSALNLYNYNLELLSSERIPIRPKLVPCGSELIQPGSDQDLLYVYKTIISIFRLLVKSCEEPDWPLVDSTRTKLDLIRICFGCIKFKFRILELLNKSCSDPHWSNVDPNLTNMALTRIWTGSIKRQFWILELLSKSCSDPNGSHVDRNLINLDLTGICFGCIQL
jgi:hypothetical protein